MKKEKKRTISVPLIAGIVIVVLIMGISAALIGYFEFTDVLEKQYNVSAYEVGDTAVSYLNPDKLAYYLETKERDEDYDRIEAMFDNLVVTMDCTFIYVAAIAPNNHLHTTYIFDSVNPSTGFSRYPLGYEADDMDPNYLEDIETILKGGRAEKYLYSYSESGAHTTAGLPVIDSKGDVVAILCVEKPMTILNEARSTYVSHVCIVVGLLIVAVLLFSFFFLRSFLIRPVREITGEAERFASDHSEPGRHLKASDNRYEIGVLARSINKMEVDIEDYIVDLTKVTAEKERIGAELQVAKHIQADMLPRIFPFVEYHNEFSLYASMTPAKEVGGDFFDFFMVDDKHLCMVIADVSGKGVPAALFMVIAKTLIKNRAMLGGDTSETLSYANDQLCDGNDAEMFVTVWMAILDITTGKGFAANAGHEHPAIRRAGGEYELVIYRHAPALAVMEGMKFKSHEFELNPGDSLFVYTDGVAEATDANNELFGTDRMLQALNRDPDAQPKTVLENVKADIDTFVGDAMQFDDITMLCLQYYGEREEAAEEE